MTAIRRRCSCAVIEAIRDGDGRWIWVAQAGGRPAVDKQEETGRVEMLGGEQQPGSGGAGWERSAGGLRGRPTAGRGQPVRDRGRRRRGPGDRPPKHGPLAFRGADGHQTGRVRPDGIGRDGRAVDAIEIGVCPTAVGRLPAPRGQQVGASGTVEHAHGEGVVVDERVAAGSRRGFVGGGGRGAAATVRGQVGGPAQAEPPAADQGRQRDNGKHGHAERPARTARRRRAAAGSHRGRAKHVPDVRAQGCGRVQPEVLSSREQTRYRNPAKRDDQKGTRLKNRSSRSQQVRSSFLNDISA